MKNPDKIIGIKDIARHAGVSTGPVDKVLNNRGGVSEVTKQKILKAVEELGYKPNILASRLKSNKIYNIAVLIPKATEQIQFWYQHDKGFDKIHKELSHFGLNLNIHHFDQNSEDSFIQAAQQFINGEYDGILLVPVFYNETIKIVEHCKEAAIPLIFFDSDLPALNQLGFIGQNSKDSGYLAADLVNGSIADSAGVLMVSIVKKDDNHTQFNTREKGFREFFEDKVRKLIKYKSVNATYKTIKTELGAILKDNPDVKAIFVTNGIHKVAAVIEELRLTGISLIGYDLTKQNITYLKKGIIRYLISQQPDKQAYLGIKLLYEHLILKQPINRHYYLPIDIVMLSNLEYYDQL